jgi:DNA-binding transcriptional regulator YiaG
MTPAKFRTARNRLGLTQRSASKAMGMGAHGWQTISKWENGHQPIPGWAPVILGLMAQVRKCAARLADSDGKVR